MPTLIDSLPLVTLDYTRGGPGLHPGMQHLERLLAEDRTGYLRVDITVGVTVPILMSRADLYVLGLQSGNQWYRFSDADWGDLSPGATSLGHGGGYKDLGGLDGSIDLGDIRRIGILADPGKRPQWKEPLRTLVVVVSECARLIPVRMHVLGLLNNIQFSIPLAPLERYIKNWSAASEGRDMSVEVSSNLRVGFSDPTIIKR